MQWLNPDKTNRRYLYALVCVDLYSTRVYIYPLKRKNAVDVKMALEVFFTDLPNSLNGEKYFQTDLGGEFFNRQVLVVYKKWNIKHYNTFSMQKAYLAENKIKQIKSYYNTLLRSKQLLPLIKSKGVIKPNKNNGDDWTSIIYFVTNKLNNKVHEITRYTPMEMDIPVNDRDSKSQLRHFLIRMRLSQKHSTKKRWVEKIQPFKKYKKRKELTRGLALGTKVFITKARKRGVTIDSPFSKPSTRNSLWDKENIYFIHQRIDNYRSNAPSFKYRLREVGSNRVLKPRFYREELRVVNTSAGGGKQKNFFPSKETYKKEYLKKWSQ
jgi:hypothetical protein